MEPILRYGADASVTLQPADDMLPTHCGACQTDALDDPAGALKAALAEPLDFPPLRQAVISDDRVAIVLDRSLPRAAELVAVVVAEMLEIGVGPDMISVIRPPNEGSAEGEDPRCGLPPELAEQVALVTHDPDGSDAVGYLAADEAGEPIVVHRAVLEADVVIPIGCIRGRGTPDELSPCGLLFPTFSDSATQRRFRVRGEKPAGKALAKSSSTRRLIEQVEHVGWLLGVVFAIQVVPGSAEGVLHVLAGAVESVHRRGQDLYREAWRSTVPARSSLVLAGIPGEVGRQTWRNVGRALAAAEALVDDGGAIAVCCELVDKPPPALAWLVEERSRDAALQRIDKHRPPGTLAAMELARAQERAKIYLLGNLDQVLVEDLEIAHISKPAELQRLFSRHRSCTLLHNASRAIVRVTTDR